MATGDCSFFILVLPTCTPSSTTDRVYFARTFPTVRSVVYMSFVECRELQRFLNTNGVICTLYVSPYSCHRHVHRERLSYCIFKVIFKYLFKMRFAPSRWTAKNSRKDFWRCFKITHYKSVIFTRWWCFFVTSCIYIWICLLTFSPYCYRDIYFLK